jgi:2-keto-4-pentenoate hydratase
MSDKNIMEAAKCIRHAYDTATPCAPVRDLLPDGDIEAAYAVQEENTKKWLAEGRMLVGRKIGLTSAAIQEQLGVDQPDYGMLFADMSVTNGEEIAAGRLLQAKIEAEIAFVLGDDLNADRLTTVDLINAIDYALPAIEIVDSRISEWDIRLTDTIADNASSGLFVLGDSPRDLSEIDLRLCGMVVDRRGEAVSIGVGAACMGNPLNATRWLAETMARVGRPLSAGDIVLSGGLGAMVTVELGDVFEARISGLGSVTAAFAAD